MYNLVRVWSYILVIFLNEGKINVYESNFLEGKHKKW